MPTKLLSVVGFLRISFIILDILFFSHRHCVDHKCPTNQLSESSNSRLNTNPTEVVIDLGVRKAESKVEQNKLDRIAMMRIKMQKSTDPSILETERLCLMVECGERGRYPVIFSKVYHIRLIENCIILSSGGQSDDASISS